MEVYCSSTLLSGKFFGFSHEANLWCLDLVLVTWHLIYTNWQLSYMQNVLYELAFPVSRIHICMNWSPKLRQQWSLSFVMSNHQLPMEKNDFRSLCCVSLYFMLPTFLIYIKLNCWTLLLVAPNHQLSLKMNDFWLLCLYKTLPVWTPLQN